MPKPGDGSEILEAPGQTQAPAGGGSQVAQVAAAIKEGLVESGREQSGPGTGAGPLAIEHEKVSGGPARTYTADEIRELVALPAETMYALTDNERWLLDKKELDIVSEKGAKALSLIMKIEPKWFVIGSAVVALGAMYAPRAIAEVKERRLKKPVQKKEG
jgi:hypothetical protein